MVFCRGCGVYGVDDICARCFLESQSWTPCETCGAPCPLKYCAPCAIEYKRNRKCGSCGVPSSRKLCDVCFRQQRAPQPVRHCANCGVTCKRLYCDACFNTPETCKGCGGKKRRSAQHEFCKRCSEYEWMPCILCRTLTPLRDLCLECAKTHCKYCKKESDVLPCFECARTKTRGCAGCGKKIFMKYTYCTQCSLPPPRYPVQNAEQTCDE